MPKNLENENSVYRPESEWLNMMMVTKCSLSKVLTFIFVVYSVYVLWSVYYLVYIILSLV